MIGRLFTPPQPRALPRHFDPKDQQRRQRAAALAALSTNLRRALNLPGDVQ